MDDVKLCVSYKNEKNLVKLDRTLKLTENVDILKETLGLPKVIDYGLKVVMNNKNPKTANCYLTEENFLSIIEDGMFLEMTRSLDYRFKYIFKHIADTQSECCEELYDLSSDPAFVNKIVKAEKEYEIMDFLYKNELTDNGQCGCLLVIFQLLKKDHIKSMDECVLTKIISIVEAGGKPSQYALSVLVQILYIKHAEFERIQGIILNQISVTTLFAFLDSNDSTNKLLNNVMLLINAFIRKFKDDRRKDLIKKLSLKEYKAIIYNMIVREGKISEDLANQLFIYQSYLLLPYKGSLRQSVACQNLDFDIVKRNSNDINSMPMVIMGSEENLDQIPFRNNVWDNISRYSLTSFDTINEDSTYSNISILTYNCIIYYKERYFANFSKSQAEENSYEPGICKSSDRVVQIMAEVLNISGKMSKKNTHFMPLFFNPEGGYFIEELYTLMMFQLSRTRKEMKAKSLQDYEKVLLVLKRKLSMIVDKKPKTFREFKIHMAEITFECVKEDFQNEREREWKQMMRQNECLRNLYEDIKKENEKIITQQRMEVLKKGDVFQILSDKKTKQTEYFKLAVSSNANVIYYHVCSDDISKDTCHCKPTVFYLNQLKHFITGEACPHYKFGSANKNKIDCMFSLIYADNQTINCLTSDSKTANYWIDGFNIIMGKTPRSVDFANELEQISSMEYSMRLIQLQDVDIPKEAPPVPPDVEAPPESEENAPPVVTHKKHKAIRSSSIDVAPQPSRIPKKSKLYKGASLDAL